MKSSSKTAKLALRTKELSSFARPRKRRQRQEKLVIIGDWQGISANLRWAAHNLNHCDQDLEIIDDLLTAIYKLGFAHGAIASRSTFTKWKEVEGQSFNPRVHTKRMVQTFLTEMAMVHHVPTRAEGNN